MGWISLFTLYRSDVYLCVMNNIIQGAWIILLLSKQSLKFTRLKPLCAQYRSHGPGTLFFSTAKLVNLLSYSFKQVFLCLLISLVPLIGVDCHIHPQKCHSLSLWISPKGSRFKGPCLFTICPIYSLNPDLHLQMWFRVNCPFPNLKLDLEINNNVIYTGGNSCETNKQPQLQK